MNYTKTIREYCNQNQGSLFDVSYMLSDYFSMVPYKTFLKIMNRLEDEGVVFTVSKGVYYIGDKESFDLDAAVKKYYIDDGNGMYVGYKMYRDLGITDIETDTVDIYTRKTGPGNKSIGKYSLHYVDLGFFWDIPSIITVLELIKANTHVSEFDVRKYKEEREKRYKKYLQGDIEMVISNIHYSYGTLVTFNEKLREHGYEYTFLNNYRGEK